MRPKTRSRTTTEATNAVKKIARDAVKAEYLTEDCVFAGKIDEMNEHIQDFIAGQPPPRSREEVYDMIEADGFLDDTGSPGHLHYGLWLLMLYPSQWQIKEARRKAREVDRSRLCGLPT